MDRLTLITIDDEAHIHAGLDAIMNWEAIGYRHVGSAISGTEGLALVRRILPDVILTDIRMPGMDGLELVRTVRTLDGYRPAIIVVSGYDDFEYARTALRYNIDDYLLKPIEEDELIARLVSVRAELERRKHTVHIDGSSLEAVANDAVRRLLSGERSEELERIAAREIGRERTTKRFFMLLFPVETELSRIRIPLPIREIRAAFGSLRAGKSADWAAVQPFGGATALIECGDFGSGCVGRSKIDLWLRGIHHLLTEKIGRPVYLAASSVEDGSGSIGETRALVFRRLTARHFGDGPGYAVIDAGGPGDPPDPTGRNNGPVRRAPPVDSVVEAVERLDAEAASGAVREAFRRFRAQGVSSDALRDWLDLLRVRIGRLALDLDDRESLPDEDMLFIAKHAEFIPLPLAAGVAERFAVFAVLRVEELRRLNRHRVVALIRHRINRRYAENISISQFAREYGMNPLYLGQLFRKIMGTGFRDYLRVKRIEEACRLLRDTDLRVSEIAGMVGYNDIDFFTDQFKRTMDVTPATFRGRLAADA